MYMVLRLSLLRFVDSNIPGDSLRTWEFHPLILRFRLSQTLWNPESCTNIGRIACTLHEQRVAQTQLPAQSRLRESPAHGWPTKEAVWESHLPIYLSYLVESYTEALRIVCRSRRRKHKQQETGRVPSVGRFRSWSCASSWPWAAFRYHECARASRSPICSSMPSVHAKQSNKQVTQQNNKNNKEHISNNHTTKHFLFNN